MTHHIIIPPITLHSGEILTNVTVHVQTWGSLNVDRNNVAIVLHALTGTTNAVEWWPQIVGPGKVINTDKHFVVCPRIHYEGLTMSPLPDITAHDVVAMYRYAADAIGIDRIQIVIGGSLGGQHAIEWAIQEPARFDSVVAVAANAIHSPWGIAFNAAQRMAIEADATFNTNVDGAGEAGLAAARAIGMISYRTYDDFAIKQSPRNGMDYPADSYQRYQGQKLTKRFSPQTYYLLTKIMDSHNVGRHRGGLKAALSQIIANTIIVGIDSDILFPTREQHFLVDHIHNATYLEMHSTVGHDAFLADQLSLATLLTSTLAH